MARKAREKSSTGIYAVILRGQTNVFEGSDLKELFSEACKKYLGDGLIAIKIFKDRAEMLVKESEKGISMDMKPLVTSFARAYNREMGNDGKVFADRFKSVPVEDEGTYEECIEYLNGSKKTASAFMPNRREGSAKPAEKANTTVSNIKPPEKYEEKVETVTAPKPEPPKKEPEKKPSRNRNLPTWLL